MKGSEKLPHEAKMLLASLLNRWAEMDPRIKADRRPVLLNMGGGLWEGRIVRYGAHSDRVTLSRTAYEVRFNKDVPHLVQWD